MNPSKYAWRVVVSMRISKDSSRFFTVEAVALQNLPQTLRGRERSKRGYASPLLTKRDRPYEAPIKADWSEVGPCTLVR